MDADAEVVDADTARANERRRRKVRRRQFPGQLQEYSSIWHGLHLMHKSRGTTQLGASHPDYWAQGAPPLPSLSSTDPMSLKEWQEKAVGARKRFKAALQATRSDGDQAGLPLESIHVADLAETSLIDIIHATRGPSKPLDTSVGLSEFDQQLMQLPDLGDLLRTFSEGQGAVASVNDRQGQAAFDSDTVMIPSMEQAESENPPSLAIVSSNTREERGPEVHVNREGVRMDLRGQLFDTWRNRMAEAHKSLRSLTDIDASLRGASEKASRTRLLSLAEKELLESEGKAKRRAANLSASTPVPQSLPESDKVKECEILVDLVIFFPSRSDNPMYEMRVLGSTLLSTVRESIKCISEINLQSTAAKDLVSRKAYFFIEGSFYAYDPPSPDLPLFPSAPDLASGNDEDDYDAADLVPLASEEGPTTLGETSLNPTLRGEPSLHPTRPSLPCQQDYVRPIIDLCCSTNSHPTHFDIRHSFRPHLRQEDDQLAPLSLPIKDVTIADLSARLSNCPTYLFGHIGSCEHLLMIRDVRLHHPEADPPLVTDYPLMLVDKVTRTHRRCELCEHNQAECVVHDDPLAPHNPYFACHACFSMLHDGATSAPKMRTFPYCPG